MVAIADGRPRQLGLKAILEYYIKHQKNVVTNRTKYDLERAITRAHILEGLLTAIRNIDKVILIIRKSKNPKEARLKLMSEFAFTEASPGYFGYETSKTDKLGINLLGKRIRSG